LLPDDLRAHRTNNPEQLAVLLLGHLEFVERFHEVLDQRIELRVGDVQALVRRAHVTARVRARTARALANLIDEILLESWNVRAGEKPLIRLSAATLPTKSSTTAVIAG